MGLFFKVKEKRETSVKKDIPWIQLRSVEQLNEVIQTTFEKPVLLFLHSTRCMTSAIALKTFNTGWTSGDELCDLYFIDLLAYRDVSDEIEVITGIKHESPQVIVLKGRDVIYDASHSSIDPRTIRSALKKS